jgi:hypothetical protein
MGVAFGAKRKLMLRMISVPHYYNLDSLRVIVNMNIPLRECDADVRLVEA